MDERIGTGREAGVNDFAAEGVTGLLLGVDGLEVTEAELVLRTEVRLLLDT